jgi:hypothetical protein
MYEIKPPKHRYLSFAPDGTPKGPVVLDHRQKAEWESKGYTFRRVVNHAGPKNRGGQ